MNTKELIDTVGNWLFKLLMLVGMIWFGYNQGANDTEIKTMKENPAVYLQKK